ncbi:SDR family oxidoreductase [Actinokineospora sp. UTMC 2448]|uniref:SDR family NAD(P)-dependent oxidoreductase n=1 Tax=Actinokineospora sp. UTMC 2448 TaxID=2268449 RepID=UPI002164C407|nr:SDR family NAD(P)-dependent oxidoreductase [Actinokineospora sp. UTMC 2448]UVS78902.1 Diacetyl reductase [(S)-acetoin forming] [Actinokineospora sp. UTMC 2448]
MAIAGKTVLVTGAGAGIGAALAVEAAGGGAAAVVAVDIDAAGAEATAAAVRERGVPAVAAGVDVADAAAVRALVAEVRAEHGPIGAVFSNAGVAVGLGLHAPMSLWEKAWAVNVRAHVHLAQAVLPGMIRDGGGHFMITASAAGLLGLPGDAPYAVTKQAAVGLAEWLACAYARHGIKVSALCPLGVRTGLLMPAVAAGHPAGLAVAELGPILEPAEVAACAVAGLADGRFLVLPHPEVAELYAKKAADPDAWIHTHASTR